MFDITPDDIKRYAVSVLGHRVILQPEYWMSRQVVDDVIRDTLDKTPVPVVGARAAVISTPPTVRVAALAYMRQALLLVAFTSLGAQRKSPALWAPAVTVVQITWATAPLAVTLPPLELGGVARLELVAVPDTSRALICRRPNCR
jgi:hypothetical protein